MSDETPNYPEQEGRTTVLTRVFDAPRELVFRCLVDPEHLVKWSSAKDWTTTFAETDIRPGGTFRIGMRPQSGTDADGFVVSGVYREIAEPERLVYVLDDGRPVTVTLTEEGGKTKLTLELTLETTYSEEQQRQGWGEFLEKLAEHLATL